MHSLHPTAGGASATGAAQRGLSLVELLVAIALMALITLATVSLYGVINSSYKTVDAGQELNDNARYAFETIGQSVRIAGYQEYLASGPDAFTVGGRIYPEPCVAGAPPCPVLGFNNSKVVDPTLATDFGATNNGGVNQSDTLGLTYSGASLLSDRLVADGSVVDCQGVSQPSTQGVANLGVSLFHVATKNGEPELACISRGITRNSQTIVRGVETFQVMYGLDTTGDSLPNEWVSAQDVSNWMQVRAIRVGFVLRGPPGSSQGAAINTADNTYHPLGKDFTGGNTEAGLVFSPAGGDGRLRRAYATTYMLRNSF